MKPLTGILSLLLLTPALSATGCISTGGTVQSQQTNGDTRWALAIHGGAGVKSKDAMTPEIERQYRGALERALAAGSEVLQNNGDSTGAVVAAIKVLENSPLFNAGRGAALDERGLAAHDASIMSGANMDAGAIAASERIRNPIEAAARLMTDTETVMLASAGADQFARASGLAMESPAYFKTEARRKAQKQKQAENPRNKPMTTEQNDSEIMGTVGAVALDMHGNLTAGTSTGGRTNKPWGRIGDSPVIGAGNYASNKSCAVSATGHGEYFMRYTVARDVCARVEFLNEPLDVAADYVIKDTLAKVGGSGAVIAIAPDGTVAFSMNGRGMYRGTVSSNQSAITAIYVDDKLE